MYLQILKNLKEEVEEELNNYFNKKIENASNEISKEALEFLKDYTLRGGKRLRVAMLTHGYGCFKEINKDVIKAGMAMELIQSYLLIHDDIMDKDELRRGKDTMHVMYEKKYNVKDKKHFSISMAICVGDLAAALANQILLETNFENKEKAVKIMNQILESVVDGQFLDIVYEKISFEEIKEEDILEVYRLKSATYTTEGPLHMGAALAGAGENDIKPLISYGIALGKAFQIRDDINGIFGSEEKTGKPNDSDLRQGKRTLLIIKTLEKCNKEEREFILKKLGTELNEEEADKLRWLIKKYGLNYCLELSEKYVEEAKKFILNAYIKENSKNFLIGIADYVANREN